MLLAGCGSGVSFSSVSVFFQCFSIFSSLCSCVGQIVFGRIKIVSVTAFFLMKNVLRHGREKKIISYRIKSLLPSKIYRLYQSIYKNCYIVMAYLFQMLGTLLL